MKLILDAGSQCEHVVYCIFTISRVAGISAILSSLEHRCVVELVIEEVRRLEHVHYHIWMIQNQIKSYSHCNTHI